jgi:hypothetical protein
MDELFCHKRSLKKLERARSFEDLYVCSRPVGRVRERTHVISAELVLVDTSFERKLSFSSTA